MAIELITGRAGVPHVDSFDVGAFNAAMFGPGAYVLSGVEATLVDANNVSVSAGELLCEGRHIRITGAGENLAIDNGLSSYKRNDIIAAKYARGEDGIEAVTLVVIKGANSTTAPIDPPMPTSGKLIDGASEVYWPLYRIVVDGLTPQTPAFIAQRQAVYTLGLGTEIPAGADLNGYKTPGTYWTANTALVSNMPPMSGTGAHVTVENVSRDVVRQTVKRAWYTGEDEADGGTVFIRHIAVDTGAITQWKATSGIDSIVAEGKSYAWNWKKYANGSYSAEAISANNLTSSYSSAGLYFFTNDFSLPFQTVGEANVFVSGRVGTGYGVSAGGFARPEQNYITVYLANVAGGTQSVSFHVMVEGRWK